MERLPHHDAMDHMASVTRIAWLNGAFGATEEIERLRRMLLAEENAADIYRIENEHLQKDRNNAVLRADEAERMLGLYREWIGDEMLAAARKKAGL
jgi:hypothetical protein